jgi:hypothetical protein
VQWAGGSAKVTVNQASTITVFALTGILDDNPPGAGPGTPFTGTITIDVGSTSAFGTLPAAAVTIGSPYNLTFTGGNFQQLTDARGGYADMFIDLKPPAATTPNLQLELRQVPSFYNYAGGGVCTLPTCTDLGSSALFYGSTPPGTTVAVAAAALTR